MDQKYTPHTRRKVWVSQTSIGLDKSCSRKMNREDNNKKTRKHYFAGRIAMLGVEGGVALHGKKSTGEGEEGVGVIFSSTDGRRFLRNSREHPPPASGR